MRDQLRALLKLNDIDASTKDLDRELKELPQRIAELRQDAQTLETLLTRERAQLEQAEQTRRAQEVEVGQGNDMLSKARAKGAKARNAREAEAAEREIESVRKSIKEREDEFARLGEAIEKVRSSLAQHTKEFDELKSSLAEEETKAQARIAQLEAERSKALTGRDEIASKLPKNVLSQYDKVRDKRGSAIADASDGTCGGCRMQLPPQQFIQLQRGESFEQCQICRRILFHKPFVED